MRYDLIFRTDPFLPPPWILCVWPSGAASDAMAFQQPQPNIGSRRTYGQQKRPGHSLHSLLLRPVATTSSSRPWVFQDLRSSHFIFLCFLCPGLLASRDYFEPRVSHSSMSWPPQFCVFHILVRLPFCVSIQIFYFKGALLHVTTDLLSRLLLTYRSLLLRHINQPSWPISNYNLQGIFISKYIWGYFVKYFYSQG